MKSEIKTLIIFFFLFFHFSNSRVIRNEAEKKRRDKLNALIQDLLMLVPHVAESPRRVDKTAVLRFSAHGLRINYGKRTGKCVIEIISCHMLNI